MTDWNNIDTDDHDRCYIPKKLLQIQSNLINSD